MSLLFDDGALINVTSGVPKSEESFAHAVGTSPGPETVTIVKQAEPEKLLPFSASHGSFRQSLISAVVLGVWGERQIKGMYGQIDMHGIGCADCHRGRRLVNPDLVGGQRNLQRLRLL